MDKASGLTSVADLYTPHTSSIRLMYAVTSSVVVKVLCLDPSTTLSNDMLSGGNRHGGTAAMKFLAEDIKTMAPYK